MIANALKDVSNTALALANGDRHGRHEDGEIGEPPSDGWRFQMSRRSSLTFASNSERGCNVISIPMLVARYTDAATRPRRR